MLRIFLLVTTLVSFSATAWASPGVDKLLNAEKAPVGVVFEVVEGDQFALDWALPHIKAQSERLKAASLQSRSLLSRMATSNLASPNPSRAPKPRG
jgi:hypothetical protein